MYYISVKISIDIFKYILKRKHLVHTKLNCQSKLLTAVIAQLHAKKKLHNYIFNPTSTYFFNIIQCLYNSYNVDLILKVLNLYVFILIR